jgi:hypothetical protein
MKKYTMVDRALAKATECEKAGDIEVYTKWMKLAMVAEEKYIVRGIKSEEF